VSRMGRKGNGHNVWLDMPREKRSLGRSRFRWEKNNIVYLKSDGMVRLLTRYGTIGFSSTTIFN
jgi:lipoate-protein ligase A